MVGIELRKKEIKMTRIIKIDSVFRNELAIAKTLPKRIKSVTSHESCLAKEEKKSFDSFRGCETPGQLSAEPF